jgi:predicted ABC-type ATPase
MPNVVLLGGPNGAGKTTASRFLLRDALRVDTFVNSDVIAQGLSGSNSAPANIEAGKIMIRWLEDLAERQMDFAFETTLSSRTFADRIIRWKRGGYRFHLIYLWLPSAEFAIQRVKDRVRRGGHDVPEKDIRRRYSSGVHNFSELYRPLADTWRCFDSSSPLGPRLVAFGTAGSQDVFDHDVWNLVHQQV